MQEFEWQEDIDELTVKGVWLEETQDTKLMTSKSHMESIYGKLTESHIALNILRDSVSEFGADIQRHLVNAMSEARERGKMMDQTAVKDVFESFEEDAKGHTDEDLPTLEPDDLPGDQEGGDGDGQPTAEDVMNEFTEQAAATDGGQE
ncbi:hypothetical protein [Natrialba sp. SSL1]|uniref:hypothetical protein n=1 Tax=Natrialba sp. SSL1 TaxID=1869245 RepID=UPI001113473C|nr:hypothetical protein [Natrialba sp. SSL1]